MSNVLTSSKLIESIKRRAMLPSDQNTFTDQDFLDMLNEEIAYFGVPHLLSTHEEYLLRFEDETITGDTNKYRIPYRAVGNKLRDVSYVDTADNVYELSRVSVEDLSEYNDNQLNSYTDSFYIQGDKIILLDQQSVNGVVRKYFYLKPNTLVKNDEGAVISAIDRNTGTITLSNFPTTFSNLPKMDFIQSKAPNKIYLYDKTPTAVNANTKTITFATADIPEQLEVGDYINLACQSIVPQLPTELHPILAQRVAVACLEALGDTEMFQVASGRLQMMEKATLDLIDNRVEGAPEKVNNRHSTLRESVRSSYGYRRRGKF